MKMLLRYLFILLAFVVTDANTSVIGATGGYYSLDAKNDSSSNNISNLGAYRIFFIHEIKSTLSINIGYNIIFEKILTGDSSFGFDLGVNYFHFGSSNTKKSKIGNIDIKVIQDWSPYVGFSFNQRQYQSIRSAYSGFGVIIGGMKSLMNKMNLILEGRYVSLTGATSSSATELTFQTGIGYEY
ncbi:MAG: hypothetical protein HN576_01335 [Bacteriovoracaceae bacterium]|nr:hypothetical protein [Bacteriovoracaceae bacterium]